MYLKFIFLVISIIPISSDFYSFYKETTAVIDMEDVCYLNKKYSDNELYYFYKVAFRENSYDFGLLKWGKNELYLYCNGSDFEKNLVKNIISEFNNKFEKIIKFNLTNNKDIADVNIFFPKKSSWVNNSFESKNKLGVTIPTNQLYTNMLKKVDIFIKTTDMNKLRMKNIVKHELMHSLGFKGHTYNLPFDNTILGGTNYKNNQINEFDYKALEILYDNRIDVYISKKKFYNKLIRNKIFQFDIY